MARLLGLREDPQEGVPALVPRVREGRKAVRAARQPEEITMKARTLTIAIAACAFALAACKPKPDTTKEEIKAGADKSNQSVSRFIVNACLEKLGAPPISNSVPIKTSTLLMVLERLKTFGDCPIHIHQLLFLVAEEDKKNIKQ